MTNDEILHLAKEYSSIYVSKNDPKSIQLLSQALDNENKYSIRITAGVKFRERFTSSVICIDCNRHKCVISPMPLWEKKPLEIKCSECQFVYYPPNIDK